MRVFCRCLAAALVFAATVSTALAGDAAAEATLANGPFYGTCWSLLPPLVAIVLALVTKEVYLSLFAGIVAGGLLHSGFSPVGTLEHIVGNGFVKSMSDAYNAGILLFLVLLGSLVAMTNKTGASASFGRWAADRLRSRAGVQVATVFLGILIFVDDYFNCLTVGGVMRPVTDAKRISRAKLAYLIDSTAAPICIIAPISSWAAAVAGFAADAGAESGFALFVRAIPYNFYAILTVLTLLFVAATGLDFGPMKRYEDDALAGRPDRSAVGPVAVHGAAEGRARMIDLVVPIAFLVAACFVGLLYTGGYFGAARPDITQAMSDSNASVGLVYGSLSAVVFAALFFLCRRVISFRDCMGAFPEGFKAMVPAIMILCCAWTLKAMTDSVGAKEFVAGMINGPAAALKAFLPAIIFAVALVLAFSTGTSWGTFGILIPIVLAAIPGSQLTVMAISACMAGAVCGDHCSPISDTTIISSAGAQCDHVVHVATQIPYAMLVAAISFAAYVAAPFAGSVAAALGIAVALILAALSAMLCLSRVRSGHRRAGAGA